MDATRVMNGTRSPGHMAASVATTASIGIVAYAAMDMCHEVLGHGVATLFVDDVTPMRLTTVALSSVGVVSRSVALAGPLMNIVLGVVTMIWFRRLTRFGTGAFFLWLFATVSLLNGTGYAMYSGALDFGDLAVAIAGREPHMAWRIGLAILGAVGYYLALRVASISLVRWLDAHAVGRRIIPQLTWSAYLAGGTLLMAGAAVSPIPNLVFLVGATGGFGCMFGLLFVRAFVGAGVPEAAGDEPWGISWPWVGAAAIVAALFVCVIGPGIALHA